MRSNLGNGWARAAKFRFPVQYRRSLRPREEEASFAVYRKNKPCTTCSKKRMRLSKYATNKRAWTLSGGGPRSYIRGEEPAIAIKTLYPRYPLRCSLRDFSRAAIILEDLPLFPPEWNIASLLKSGFTKNIPLRTVARNEDTELHYIRVCFFLFLPRPLFLSLPFASRPRALCKLFFT